MTTRAALVSGLPSGPVARIGLIIGLWTIPALLASTQMYIRLQARGNEISWLSALLTQLPQWYAWALLTPAVFWIARRIPLERRRFVRGIGTHMAAAIVAGLLVAAVVTPVAITVEGRSVNPTSYGPAYLRLLTVRLHLDMLVYWALVGVATALEYRRKLRAREVRTAQLEAEVAQAQLQALKMEIQPHFLFNTLHTISALVRHKENRTAISMLAKLSDLLRYTLDHADSPTVLLRDELRFLQRYLDIEQVRFHDRLTVEVAAEPATLEALVPTLILQPLVENAIRHGVGPTGRQGHVTIRANRQSGELVLEVADNGVGLPRGWAAAPTEGIGLRSTRRRLARFGNGGGRLDVRRRAGGGVEAIVRIPWVTRDD